MSHNSPKNIQRFLKKYTNFYNIQLLPLDEVFARGATWGAKNGEQSNCQFHWLSLHSQVFPSIKDFPRPNRKKSKGYTTEEKN